MERENWNLNGKPDEQEDEEEDLIDAFEAGVGAQLQDKVLEHLLGFGAGEAALAEVSIAKICKAFASGD